MIGVDFDNTVVCYDRVFPTVAVEQGLVPASVTRSKQDVRDFLQGEGRNDLWTRLQGEVYGPRILDAEPFPGVLKFFQDCRRAGVSVVVISHKTQLPAVGPRGPEYDLHAAAHRWLQRYGFYDLDGAALTSAQVYMEPTRADKIRRIAELGCTHFVDDLPECLLDPVFPNATQRLLFDPHALHARDPQYDVCGSWEEVGRRIMPLAVAGQGR